MTTYISYSNCTYNISFGLGETVYHRAKHDKVKGIITDLRLCVDGGHIFTVRWGDNTTSDCYSSELTDTFLPEYAED